MLAEVSGGACEVDDRAEVLEQLVAYAVGGFGAAAHAPTRGERA